MTAPVIAHEVCTTEAGAPDEPTSPAIVELVHVTAPPFPGVALRTAKLDAVPSDGPDDAANAGKAPPISVATPRKNADRYLWRLFIKHILY